MSETSGYLERPGGERLDECCGQRGGGDRGDPSGTGGSAPCGRTPSRYHRVSFEDAPAFRPGRNRGSRVAGHGIEQSPSG